MDEDKWCEKCEVELSEYVYNGKGYCIECLLEQLTEEDKIRSWTVNHYMLDDEYQGNDNDDYIDDIASKIAEALNIQKIEKD